MHLIGQHLLGALVEEFEDMEEMEEEMLDEEEGDDSQFKVCIHVSTFLPIPLIL